MKSTTSGLQTGNTGLVDFTPQRAVQGLRPEALFLTTFRVHIDRAFPVGYHGASGSHGFVAIGSPCSAGCRKAEFDPCKGCTGDLKACTSEIGVHSVLLHEWIPDAESSKNSGDDNGRVAHSDRYRRFHPP